MKPPIKSTGWARAPHYLSGPSAGLPTKKVPGEELQQYGFAPNVSPGAAELNWVLNQADALVEAFEMFGLLNFNAEVLSGALPSIDVVGAFRPPAGGTFLVLGQSVVWVPETGSLNHASTYTPFGAAELQGVVACTNVTTMGTPTPRDVLLCLRSDDNISGFGASETVWPRDTHPFDGLGPEIFLELNNRGTGDLHGAWDETNQVVHVADSTKVLTFPYTSDMSSGSGYGTELNMADNPWGESVGGGVRVRCGGGSAVVFGVANDGAKSYYSHNAGVTWNQGITLGEDLIPPNVTTGLTRYVAHWYSDYAECWYLLVRGSQGVEPLLHCYRSVDNGVTWDFLDTWTNRLLFWELSPAAPRQVARIRHLVCFAFPTQPDVVSGNSEIQTGMAIFDEIDLTLRTICMFGGDPIAVLSDGNRLIWTREHDEDQIYAAVGQVSALPIALRRS